MLTLFLLAFASSFFMTFLANVDGLVLAIWEE